MYTVDLLSQGEKEILQITIEKSEINKHELKMLQYCEIKGILKPMVQQQEPNLILIYDITELENISPIQHLDKFLKQLQELNQELPHYYLSAEGILIASEHIFYYSGNWQFIYIPLCQKKNIQDLDFFASMFESRPSLRLQMEMMKENSQLSFTEYLKNM